MLPAMMLRILVSLKRMETNEVTLVFPKRRAKKIIIWFKVSFLDSRLKVQSPDTRKEKSHQRKTWKLLKLRRRRRATPSSRRNTCWRCSERPNWEMTTTITTTMNRQMWMKQRKVIQRRQTQHRHRHHHHRQLESNADGHIPHTQSNQIQALPLHCCTNLKKSVLTYQMVIGLQT